MKLLPEVHPTQDTIKISPRRIFKCKNDNRSMLRKDVWKDGMGHYRCSACGGLVEDVTDTETGKSLMEVLAI